MTAHALITSEFMCTGVGEIIWLHVCLIECVIVSVCVCVCDLPLMVFLLMNPPSMWNTVYPQCNWLLGRHGNTVSRMNGITATCHHTAGAGGERERERESKSSREWDNLGTGGRERQMIKQEWCCEVAEWWRREEGWESSDRRENKGGEV